MNLNKKNFYYFFPMLVGKNTLNFIFTIGSVFSFLSFALSHAFFPPFYIKEYLKQIIRVGWASLPVVGLTAFFTGGALALQIYSGGTRLNAESAVPSIVAIGFLRELGPVLCGLMVAGRVSASIAAEIATMKVTEQVDALTTLGADPIKYLASPRIIVTTMSLPILTAIGNIIGIFGGFLISTERLGFNPTFYIESSIRYIEISDIYSSLIKAAVFGMVISTMGCYFGFKASKGALGVGKATTDAVVFSSILILAFNYFLTELLFRT
tara:strand:- start:176 stop:976 length:801 start_codon:yes stop_codon:yes gene_type:complete